MTADKYPSTFSSQMEAVVYIMTQWGFCDRDFPLFNAKTNKFCAMHMTGAVLEEYSRTRNKDAEAICDLSMYNYLEVSLKSYSFWSAISFCHEIEVRHHVVVVLIQNMTVGLGGGRGGEALR